MRRILAATFLILTVATGTSSAVTFNLNIQVRERAVLAEHFGLSPDGDCQILDTWSVGGFTETAQIFGQHFPVLPLVDVSMEKIRICIFEIDGEPVEEWTTLSTIAVTFEVPPEAIEIDSSLGRALVRATVETEDQVSGTPLTLDVRLAARAIGGIYPSETLHLLTQKNDRKENFRRTAMSRDAEAEVSVTDQNGTEYFTAAPDFAVIERILTGRLQLFRE